MQKAQKIAELQAQVVLACHKLYARRLVANHDGNITVKIGNVGSAAGVASAAGAASADESACYLATPTSFSKGDIQIDDLLLLDAAGKVVEGRHKVFSEISWHLAIYRARPDVTCVVHAHPPAAAAFSLTGREIGTPAIPEAIVSLGRHILSTRFISPLDPALAKGDTSALELEFGRVLHGSDAFLVPGNGAWTVGHDVLQTYYRMELVEHVAEQHRYAETLGHIRALPETLVEDLMAKRPKPAAAALSAPDVPTAPVVSLPPLPALSPVPAGAKSTPLIERADIAAIVRDEIARLLK